MGSVGNFTNLSESEKVFSFCREKVRVQLLWVLNADYDLHIWNEKAGQGKNCLCVKFVTEASEILDRILLCQAYVIVRQAVNYWFFSVAWVGAALSIRWRKDSAKLFHDLSALRSRQRRLRTYLGSSLFGFFDAYIRHAFLYNTGCQFLEQIIGS